MARSLAPASITLDAPVAVVKSADPKWTKATYPPSESNPEPLSPAPPPAPIVVPASLTIPPAKPANPPGKPDSNLRSDAVASSDKLALPANIPAPSDQNSDPRASTPVQVPAAANVSVIASQPSPALLDMESSLASTSAIQTYAALSPSGGQLAFVARIKPESAALPQQMLPASGPGSVSHGVPYSQVVNTAGETSAKEGDTGHDQPENGEPVSMTAAAKSPVRKDDPDTTASAVEPNVPPVAQTIPQALTTSLPAQPGLQASLAPPVQSAAAPETAHALLDRPLQAPSPARNISLQVEAASGETVDIRMSARSGDLNVAVRAGDDNMAQNLRQGLGDLETRLAQSGYHAETWHPGHSGSTPEPAAPAGNSSNSSSQQQQQQQQSQSGSGGSQQNRGERDNNPSNRPQWVNQLASTLKAESTEKGNDNGIAT